MAGLLDRLTTKASVPLLLIVYVALVLVFCVEFPTMGDGASWVSGTAPSTAFVAWGIAFPCLLVAFGIAALLARAATDIERRRGLTVPAYVRVANVAVWLGCIATNLLRNAGPEMRTTFFCTVVIFLVWLVAWPTYVVRTYGER